MAFLEMADVKYKFGQVIGQFLKPAAAIPMAPEALSWDTPTASLRKTAEPTKAELAQMGELTSLRAALYASAD